MSSSVEKRGPQLVTVGEEAEEQRIDNYLLRVFKGVPRSRVYRMLRKGEVRVNGGRVKPTRRLQIGDKVRLPPAHVVTPDAPTTLSDRQKADIESFVIYQDKGLIVLNKPSGLAVHGGSGISSGVIERLRLARPKETGLELVHRLDRDTSGLLLIARRRSALRRLHELQRAGQVEKTYLALLHGGWHKGRVDCSVALKKNVLKSGERVVRADPEGKAALTRFTVLKRFSDAMLVEARLETGRTHQIRVHAQSLGTAIIGDDKYGEDSVNQQFRKLGIKRLFLHAVRLRFRWGDDDQLLTLEAPLDERLQKALENLPV